MNFNALVRVIAEVHHVAGGMASKTVNSALTLRNWLIGAYIVEFEQQGEDRAAYGDRLLPRLADHLQQCGLPRSDARELRRPRLFYLSYPQIRETLSPHFLSARSLPPKRETVSPVLALTGGLLIDRLSFSHFDLLMELEPPIKRSFYEIECAKGNWSVRELKRQIGSLYFERSGLSKNPAKLSEMANTEAIQDDPALVIRDPYIFEFLGLRPGEVLPESDLEAALIEKMRDFLLELGRGFCFEARQKRLLIGGEHFFVDLVFYHRLLKCHVLVELKVGAFSHEHLGQLNTYVAYYRKHEMAEGDQPPVGILLCADKNRALAEYALAGMDNRLFVSKYQLELPGTEVLQRYLDEQRLALEGGML
ncbi:MAG: PDDEXK nuclease domain-containing protein [Azoarcus sp.]|jgi:predicted nuclease of restriction endonuclease-like (RecB) superfamily|nr:PDDEXK nuclease domain-containing protein [Azoarcus sp.]